MSRKQCLADAADMLAYMMRGDRSEFIESLTPNRRESVSQTVKYHAGQTGWWEVWATHDNVVVQFCQYTDGLRIRTVSFDGGQTDMKIPWPFGDNPTPNEVITTAISTAARAYEEQALTSPQPPL